MSSPTTVVSFLEVVTKSGLVSKAQIDELFDEGAPADPNQCASALIKAELLTSYQAKQLLTGKYRGFILGPYKILRPIGQGGMGTVFLAEHTSLSRRVALKVLTAEKAKDKLTLERFHREARAAAALDHPNIVKLYDISQGNGVQFLVMEYVDGKDLQAFLAETGAMHYAQAAQYIAQAACGLHHAHEKGFIHRDIKPANLMLTREGAVKVLDMGLARSFTNKKDDLTTDLANGDIAGTVDYLSPEQAMNQPLDERSDIYSLGATFYALVTGHPPFNGTTAQKLMQHQLKEPPSLSVKLRGRVPEGLSNVIAKMMAKKPSDRYQTASDVVDALGPWLPAMSTGNIVHDPVTVSNLTPPPKGLSSRKSRRAVGQPGEVVPLWKRPPVLIGGGIGAGVLAIGIVLALVLGGGGEKNNNTARPPGNPPSDNGVVPPPKPADDRFQFVSLGASATASAGGPLFTEKEHDRFAFSQWGKLTFFGVPFNLPDPNDTNRNIVVLHSPLSTMSGSLPRSVTVPYGGPAQKLHFLSGVSAWGWHSQQPSGYPAAGAPCMVVRLKYADQTTEEHVWKNGEEFADFFHPRSPVEVPRSQLAVTARNAQVRYLSITPKHTGKSIESIEFAKAEEDNTTSPIVIAVTVERPAGSAAAPAPTPVAPARPVERAGFRPVSFAGVATESASGPLFNGMDRDKFEFSPSGRRLVLDVPFDLPDPTDTGKNIITLYGPHSERTQKLPKSVVLPLKSPAKTIHFLSGVNAWGWPWKGFNNVPDSGTPRGTTTITVRLKYADGKTEDYDWRNGEEFADFVEKIDVPNSKYALRTRNNGQVRYLTITPDRPNQTIESIEFIKGADDKTAPVVFAVTVEHPEGKPPADGGKPKDPAEKSSALPKNMIPLDLTRAATQVASTPPADGQWGMHTVSGVPFDLVDPKGGRANAVRPADGPVKVSCFLAGKAVHLLGGVPTDLPDGGIVGKLRLHYAGGVSESFEWKLDAKADTIKMALPDGFRPQCGSFPTGRGGVVQHIEFESAGKTAPLILAVTVETA